MRKILGKLLLSILLVSIIGGTTFVKAAEQERITFQNHSYDKSKLSDETVTWLEWYNSLSPDIKETINYTPSELSTNFNNKRGLVPYAAEVMETDKSFENSFRAAAVGSAPAYNPSYWNDSSRINKANCYAYAMDIICKKDMKLQPGQLGGKQFTSLTKSNIITAVKADGPYLGNGRTIRASTKGENAGNKEYKVALVIAPNVDYHWYIQNKDGYWSHKRGQTKASNLDASGKKILDPKTCDRKYSDLDYSTWCGYYMVTRK